MIPYILKTVLCSALLLSVYLLFLEKEKMHRFNRFYLLGSLVFSFAIPFITIATGSAPAPVTEFINLPGNVFPKTIAGQADVSPAYSNALPIAFLILYSVITLFLLCRFIKNIWTLNSRIKNNITAPYLDATIVLTADRLIPHSFFKYIFIDKDAFEKGGVEQEILRHELTHVRQKHSLDILLLELLLIFVWFNPFLFLYRKAIRLNHEFLADAHVIKVFSNPTAYQYLLLEKASQACSLSLTSQFNYLITKKRLIMMTRKTTRKVAILKQLALLPLLIGVFLLFSSRSYTQTTKDKPAVTNNKIVYGTGASAELLAEYDTTVKNITTIKTLKNGKQVQNIDLTKCDAEKMANIFKLMNKEQKDARSIITGITFISITTPPAKKSPTDMQLQAWADSKKYGIWVDGKRIANSELAKYSPADFVLYWESKLAKNAVNYGNHYYQVDLYSPAYYDESYKKKTK